MMRRWLWWMVGVGVAGGVGACAPAARKGTLQSDDPAAKLYAIQRAAAVGEAGKAGEAGGDRGAVPQLVPLLDDDDPAVRMFTIQALERLTGERLGYDPYADRPARRPAYERWIAFVNDAGAQKP